MFYHTRTKVIKEIVDFSEDEFKLKILNEQPEFLWVYSWSATKPLFKLHEIKDDNVLISCFAWADKTPKIWTWKRFYHEMTLSTLSQLHTSPKEVCPSCGADIVAKMSGVECSNCDWWFCY